MFPFPAAAVTLAEPNGTVSNEEYRVFERESVRAPALSPHLIPPLRDLGSTSGLQARGLTAKPIIAALLSRNFV